MTRFNLLTRSVLPFRLSGYLFKQPYHKSEEEYGPQQFLFSFYFFFLFSFLKNNHCSSVAPASRGKRSAGKPTTLPSVSSTKTIRFSTHTETAAGSDPSSAIMK